jgi:curved DNA-binding protein
MDYQDYYQTLGLKRDATTAEIKKAFRRLAREHHPDAKPGDEAAERRFKAINEAHAVLSDPEKRKKYDLLGSNWEAYQAAPGSPSGADNPFAGFTGFGGPGAGGRSGNVRYEFRTSSGDAGEFSDFFRMFFDDAAAGSAQGPGGARSNRGRPAGGPTFDDILGQIGLNQPGALGPRPAGRPVSTRQAAVEATAEIDLEEAFTGTTRRLEINGKRLEVTIPRGADSGTKVKLSGQAGDGRDVVVVVKVRPHPVFRRRGADLERDLPITLREALLGAEVPVTTLKGKGLLKIPAGTQAGRTFRLTGQGMPHLRGDGRGDLLARIRVVLPTNLGPEAEAAGRTFLDLVDQPDPR